LYGNIAIEHKNITLFLLRFSWRRGFKPFGLEPFDPELFDPELIAEGLTAEGLKAEGDSRGRGVKGLFRMTFTGF
jgi:hypothetical protein